MNKDFLAWLYGKAQAYYCGRTFDCSECYFYCGTDPEHDCTKLPDKRMREILMEIYESEVDANEKDTDTIQANL